MVSFSFGVFCKSHFAFYFSCLCAGVSLCPQCLSHLSVLVVLGLRSTQQHIFFFFQVFSSFLSTEKGVEDCVCANRIYATDVIEIVQVEKTLEYFFDLNCDQSLCGIFFNVSKSKLNT